MKAQNSPADSLALSAEFSDTDHARGMARLVQTVQELSLARSLPDVQRIVRTAARELTGCDGASFVLRDDDKCYYADEDAIAPLWKGSRFPLADCVSGWAMLNRDSAVIPTFIAMPASPRGVPAHIRQEPGDGSDPQTRPDRGHRQLLGL